MKKRPSKETTPRSGTIPTSPFSQYNPERRTPTNQQNESPVSEGSFLGQTWQKSANVTYI